MNRFKTSLLTAGLVLLPSLASAQTDISTTNPANWTGCATQVPGSCTPAGATGSIGLAAGWKPGPWIAPDGQTSRSPSGPGENPAWSLNYGYKFLSDGFTSATFSVTRFQLDNYLVGFYLNGVELEPLWRVGSIIDPLGTDPANYGGIPALPNGENWTKVFGFVASGDLIDGENLFEVRTTGNGVTDGMALNGELRLSDPGIVQVPEPASFALIVFGLGALGVTARRRRNVA